MKIARRVVPINADNGCQLSPSQCVPSLSEIRQSSVETAPITVIGIMVITTPIFCLSLKVRNLGVCTVFLISLLAGSIDIIFHFIIHRFGTLVKVRKLLR